MKIVIFALLLLLAVTVSWPRVRISASPEGHVCAACPIGFVNNATWITSSSYSVNQQWAEYVNDASKGHCSIDWRLIFTGKSSYTNSSRPSVSFLHSKES